MSDAPVMNTQSSFATPAALPEPSESNAAGLTVDQNMRSASTETPFPAPTARPKPSHVTDTYTNMPGDGITPG